MKKFYLLVLLLILVGQVLQAQITKVTLLTGKPAQYKKTEWDIRLTGTWQNPYLQEDVSLDMLLVSPSGKKLTLPCYFESGESGKESLWKARFTPQETGKYKYSFRFSKSGKPVNSSKTTSFSAVTSAENGFLHPKSNWILQFDNGKPFRGVGENICWESRANDDSKFFKKLHENPRFNYNYMLSELAKNGGNFYRTWISSFNLPLDWKRGFNSNRYTPSDNYFNPSAIAKIDSMINLTDSLKVYIMFTLGPGAYGLREGGFSASAADFFVNPKSKQRYKNRLRYLIARWGYSTSICAWELFNEIDNVQFGNKNKPISADSIVQWHDEMSTYIKQTDPYKHLVTTSISHRDLKGLNSLKDIDINQKHIYRNTGAIPSTIEQYENDFKKPYVIGEYSFEWDWSKNFDDYAEDMDVDFKRGLWYGMFSPTPILPLSWWWEYFDNRGIIPYFKGVREISDQMLEAGNGSFEKVVVEAGSLEAYGVKCGKKIFVYLYNNTANAMQTNLLVKAVGNSQYEVQSFVPSSRLYKSLGVLSAVNFDATLTNVALNTKNEQVLIFSAR
jgi:Endo-beta-mannanase